MTDRYKTKQNKKQLEQIRKRKNTKQLTRVKYTMMIQQNNMERPKLRTSGQVNAVWFERVKICSNTLKGFEEREEGVDMFESTTNVEMIICTKTSLELVS